MFFEVPGLNLGAPATEVKKPDHGQAQGNNNASNRSKSKPTISKFKNLFTENIKSRNGPKKSSESEKIPLKQASPVSKAAKVSNQPPIKVEKDSGKSKLQQKMEKQLCGARFRYLNQKLYQSHSHEALSHFKEHPEDFDKVFNYSREYGF